MSAVRNITPRRQGTKFAKEETAKGTNHAHDAPHNPFASFAAWREVLTRRSPGVVDDLHNRSAARHANFAAVLQKREF